MALADSGEAPYAPVDAVWSVVETYRDRALTTPVTVDVLSRCGVSDSLTQRTLRTLKLLDLLTEDGQPTQTFDAIKKAPTEQFHGVLVDWLHDVYEPIFRYVNPVADDPVRVGDQFRHYDPAGQRNRMVTLFYGLCVRAGILEQTPAMPRGKSSQSSAKKAALKKPAPTPADRTTPPPDRIDPPPPVDPGSDPLLVAFFAKLPPSGSIATPAQRETWLSTLSGIFAMIYEEGPG